MKEQPLWAIRSPHGWFTRYGRSIDLAWSAAEWDHKSTRQKLRKEGYRCVRVLPKRRRVK